MRKSILILLTVGVFFACSPSQKDDNGNTITLKGEVENPMPSGNIILEKIWQNDVTPVDTVKLDEGNTFAIDVEVNEPDLYRLNFYNRKVVLLILDKQDIELKVDVQDPSKMPEIKGSEETKYLGELNAMMQEKQRKVSQINTQFQAAAQAQDQDQMAQLRKEYMDYEKQFNEQLKAAIDRMGTSVAAFYALTSLDWEQEFPFADSVTEKFKAEKPDSKYTKVLTEKAEAMRTLAIGSPAPEIALPNPDGEIVKLSSLQGNYVLLDFWASWCRPCRKENPNVVRMYNKYHDQGFEVYSVSLDKKKEKWLQGIEEDNMTWTHVSDLKYFNSEAASTYQINAIPFTLLLDKEGNIMAKNLRGEQLEAKLAEIFGE